MRLFVLGKRGEHADFAKMHLGSEVERAVRAVHRPLLVASRQFKPIERFMIAFDGSATTRKGVEMVAGSPLFKDLACHVLMLGTETDEARHQIQWAQETLSAAGLCVQAHIRAGNAEATIAEYVSANGIGLIVMGARTGLLFLPQPLGECGQALIAAGATQPRAGSRRSSLAQREQDTGSASLKRELYERGVASSRGVGTLRRAGLNREYDVRTMHE